MKGLYSSEGLRLKMSSSEWPLETSKLPSEFLSRKLIFLVSRKSYKRSTILIWGSRPSLITVKNRCKIHKADQGLYIFLRNFIVLRIC